MKLPFDSSFVNPNDFSHESARRFSFCQSCHNCPHYLLMETNPLPCFKSVFTRMRVLLLREEKMAFSATQYLELFADLIKLVESAERAFCSQDVDALAAQSLKLDTLLRKISSRIIHVGCFGHIPACSWDSQSQPQISRMVS
jgi:hypothetical protein